MIYHKWLDVPGTVLGVFNLSHLSHITVLPHWRSYLHFVELAGQEVIFLLSERPLDEYWD